MGDVRVSEDVVTQVVQTAVVRPGDTLILRLGTSATPEMVKNVADAVKEGRPDLDVLVLGNVDEMAIYRSEKLHSVELSPPNVDELAEAVADNMQRRAGLQRRRTG